MKTRTVALTLTVLSVYFVATSAQGGFLGALFGNGGAQSTGDCPPAGFDAIPGDEFDLARYISAPWYTVKQVPTTFQPANTLYCVRAEYVPINPDDLSAGVLVNNYANDGEVNGPVVGTNTGGGFPGRFVGVPTEQASKLNVGFALPGTNTPLINGPYWVVALDKENYSWAVIVSGPPDTPSGDGCIQDEGTWLFVRDPSDTAAAQAAEDAAIALGIDTSALTTVPQEGCTYSQ